MLLEFATTLTGRLDEALVAFENTSRLWDQTERAREQLTRLYDEGRRLTEDQACRLAMPPRAA